MILDHKLIACGSKTLLAWFGLAVATSAALVVFANNLYQINSHHLYLSTFCFMLSFALAMASRPLSLLGFIFLIPLLPTIDIQLQAFLGIQVQSQPGAGLDLAAGFFLGVLTKHFLYRAIAPQSQALANITPPWQVGAVLLVVTVSTLLAVTRNAWQSAAAISFKGLVFSLIQFRAIGRYEDYQPLTDWVAYGLAGATVAALVAILKEMPNRDQLVFRSLIAGLVVSGILGIVQTFTGLGVVSRYRYDDLGVTALGFQPDLHAFGGYLLLGTIGLWGYLSGVRLSSERHIIALTILVSWLGLMLSKSRAHILLSLCVFFFGLLIFIWRHKRRWFFPSLAFIGSLFVLLLISFFTFFAWPAELVNQFSALDLSNFSSVSATLAHRPEIYMAALRMIFIFPFMGLGQGNFFRMSANQEFSQSPHLSVTHNGENAHNYFLQTVAETGLIGGIVFSVALLAPFFLVRDRRVLLPAVVGLFSLFLGNIYAHSFLIRENLILASTLLALMYAWVVAKQSSTVQPATTATDATEMPNESLEVGKHVDISSNTLHENGSNKPWFKFLKRPLVIAAIVCGVMLGASREVYQSFQNFPFQYGTLCFAPKPLTVDGWSSGIYELTLPAGSHGVTLPLRIIRPGLGRQPLGAQLQIVNMQGTVLAGMTSEWKAVGNAVMELRLANNQVVADGGSKAILKLSSCFTPRNIGMNMDGRRLGVLVDHPVIF